MDGVQIYQYPDAANADGIDIDSSRDVIVRNTMVDSNDDHLCVKSGANWLGKRDTPLRLLPPRSSLTANAPSGWQAGVPSENIVFEDCEIRSGHGMTLGSVSAICVASDRATGVRGCPHSFLS